MKANCGTRCPPGVKALLNIANALPLDTQLPQSDWTWEWDRIENFNPYDDPYNPRRLNVHRLDKVKARDRAFQKWCRNLASRFTGAELMNLFRDFTALGYERGDFITEYSKGPTDAHLIVAAVEQSLKYRKFIRALLDHSQKHMQNKGKYGEDFSSFTQLPSMPPRLMIRFRDNKFDYQVDPALEVIKESDCFRIRECKICNKFFWAVRSDAEACSGRCGNTLNSRRHRVRELEKRVAAAQEGISKRRSVFGPAHEIPADVVRCMARLEVQLTARKKKCGLV